MKQSPDEHREHLLNQAIKIATELIKRKETFPFPGIKNKSIMIDAKKKNRN